jgi:hypothetical protein
MQIQTSSKMNEAILMFVLVSSNLADLMGASRPRSSQHLFEILRADSEVSDTGLVESVNSGEQRTEDRDPPIHANSLKRID